MTKILFDGFDSSSHTCLRVLGSEKVQIEYSKLENKIRNNNECVMNKFQFKGRGVGKPISCIRPLAKCESSHAGIRDDNARYRPRMAKVFAAILWLPYGQTNVSQSVASRNKNRNFTLFVLSSFFGESPVPFNLLIRLITCYSLEFQLLQEMWNGNFENKTSAKVQNKMKQSAGMYAIRNTHVVVNVIERTCNPMSKLKTKIR